MSPSEQERLLADVEAFCQEVRPIEELCYVEHRFNDQVLPLARKHDILAMPVPPAYGGRGADAVTYARALVRIGREGTGVRTFFSGHTSIGEYPILTWGNEDQKKRYLPAAARGDKVLAFGLTEPEAGSNPLEMQTTYERRGDKFVLNGVKYLISNGGICDAVVAFGYPKNPADGRSAASAPSSWTGRRLRQRGPDGQAGDADGQHRHVRPGKLRGPGRQPARRGGRRLPHRDGHAGQRPAQRGGRLARRDRGLPGGGDFLCQGAAAARQGDRPASAGSGTHRGHRDAPGRVGRDGDAGGARPRTPARRRRTTPELKRQADLTAAQAKLFVANAAWDAADRAVQVFGGRGWSTLYRPGRHLMDVRVCRIYEGTDEILKLKVAAAVLGKEYEAFK